MFKNYLKIAVRYLWKNKMYSLINIFGLGVAIAVSITGYINYPRGEVRNGGVLRLLGIADTPGVPALHAGGGGARKSAPEGRGRER